jgi:flagellar biosynthesis protein FlhF
MRIKSYFCRTVEDAMALASQELGPEAILVNSRKALAEARHLGEYEVVFATEAAGELPADFSAGGTPALPGGAAASDRLAAEVADLKRELEGMRRTLLRTAIPPTSWMGASADLPDAYAALIAAEVPAELAREIVQAAERRAAGSLGNARAGVPQPAGLRQALVEELEARIMAQPALGRGEGRPRITALVGPPGSGKTTTLVKLAVNYGLASRRPVLLLSMDTYRVAAAEQLRSYAAILGVGFQVLETLAALAQAIEESRSKDLILIDTPGFGFGDMDAAGPLARFLSSRSDIDTQLVLPASMKPGDMTRVAEAFEAFGPQRLLFTKLDETGSFGPILAEAGRSGKPLSFFTTGQRIPEDLDAASRSRLVELVLAGQGVPARSAA